MEASKRGKTVPNDTDRNTIIEKTHTLGHFGVESMFRNIWHQGYWWPDIRRDLRETVQSCLDCLRHDTSREGYHPLKSIEAMEPWDHIQVDCIGPVPAFEEGHTTILTIIDVMTGYTVLKALKEHTKQAMARKL